MIAIPNMEKPKSCIECDSDFGYAVSCKLWYDFKDWRKRTHPNCPLIEISDVEYKAFKEFTDTLFKRLDDHILHGE